MKRSIPLITAALATFGSTVLLAVDRFPRPEFETDHALPLIATPPARAISLEWMDVGILFLALAAASYLAIKARSRRGMVLLSFFSLLYFGFFRKGCVCSIGSIQNVSLAIADTTYAIPLTVIVFFVLPLFFALVWGRTFCAGVCPMGAMQDLALVRHTRLPHWLTECLSMGPYLYLGFGVLLAATGTSFIICAYDPFVGFFRLGANMPIMVFSFAILLLSTVVGRPYCRFLCPYGVLLGWMSRYSRWHVSITPNECINCRLCEEACPYGAIQKPSPATSPESRDRGISRLLLLLLLLPVSVAFGGAVVSRLATPLSRSSLMVRTAEQLALEELHPETPTTLDSETFRVSGESMKEQREQVQELRRKLRTGGWWVGGLIALCIHLRLVGLAVWRYRPHYTIDRERCVSCTRCFNYCPKERELRNTRTMKI